MLIMYIDFQYHNVQSYKQYNIQQYYLIMDDYFLNKIQLILNKLRLIINLMVH